MSIIKYVKSNSNVITKFKSLSGHLSELLSTLLEAIKNAKDLNEALESGRAVGSVDHYIEKAQKHKSVLDEKIGLLPNDHKIRSKMQEVSDEFEKYIDKLKEM